MVAIKRSNAPDIVPGILYFSLRKSMQVSLTSNYRSPTRINLSGMTSPIVFIGDTNGAAVTATYLDGKCEMFASFDSNVQIYIFDAWRAPASSGGVGIRLRDSEGVTFDTGWHLLNAEQIAYVAPALDDPLKVCDGYAACLPSPSLSFTDLKKFYSGGEDTGGRLVQDALTVSNGSISVSSATGAYSNYDTPAADTIQLGSRFVMLGGGDGALWVADVANVPTNFG